MSLTVLLALVFLAGGVGYFFYDRNQNKKQEQHFEELRAKRAAKRDLAAKKQVALDTQRAKDLQAPVVVTPAPEPIVETEVGTAAETTLEAVQDDANAAWWDAPQEPLVEPLSSPSVSHEPLPAAPVQPPASDVYFDSPAISAEPVVSEVANTPGVEKGLATPLEVRSVDEDEQPETSETSDSTHSDEKTPDAFVEVESAFTNEVPPLKERQDGEFHTAEEAPSTFEPEGPQPLPDSEPSTAVSDETPPNADHAVDLNEADPVELLVAPTPAVQPEPQKTEPPVENAFNEASFESLASVIDEISDEVALGQDDDFSVAKPHAEATNTPVTSDDSLAPQSASDELASLLQADATAFDFNAPFDTNLENLLAPITPASVGATESSSSAPSVLLVDDSRTFRVRMENILRDGGCQVTSCVDGQEAFDLLRSGNAPKIDVIISDIDMPEMDGYTFFAALQAEKRLKSIPFVIVTGSYENVEKANRLGVKEALMKPFGEKEIEAALRRQIPQFF